MSGRYFSYFCFVTSVCVSEKVPFIRGLSSSVFIGSSISTYVGWLVLAPSEIYILDVVEKVVHVEGVNAESLIFRLL